MSKTNLSVTFTDSLFCALYVLCVVYVIIHLYLYYRLYFLSGNLTEVKTIKSKDPRLEFQLTDLAPSSLYYVWIKAFTWKNEGVSSSRLSIRTDVTRPSPPVISNISCHENRSITVSWTACSYSHCDSDRYCEIGVGRFAASNCRALWMPTCV